MKFSNQEYFGFARYARSGDGQWRLHFNWRRIACVVVVLGVVAYLALATLLFCWFRYKQEWEPTKFSEMLVYPFSVETRVALRKNIGDKIISDAKGKFTEDGDFGDYFRSIRAGLVYSPNNPDGRIDFSSLLFFQKRTREALEFLREGLPYAVNHKTYVQFFVQQSLENSYDDMLISAANEILPAFSIAEKTLPEKNNANDNRLIMIVGAAQANLLRGRFEAARTLLETYHLTGTVSGRVLIAQIDWENGQRERALENLGEICRQSPGLEQVALLYALYLKEDGKLSAARDVLFALALRKSDDSAIRIRILGLFDGDDNLPYRARLIRDFISRYENNSDALLALTQYATDNKNFQLVKQLYDKACEKMFDNLPKFELLYIESLIMNGQSGAALKILEDLDSGNYVWVNNYQGVLDCLRALAYYSTNQSNLGKINIERIIKNQSVPAARLIVLARRLEGLGFKQEARNLYENAYLLDNRNQTVLIELVNYALENEDVAMMVRYLPPLLDTRRPPRGVLEKVQNFLGSDRMLFIVKRENLINSVTQMLDESKGEKISVPDDTVLQSWF